MHTRTTPLHNLAVSGDAKVWKPGNPKIRARLKEFGRWLWRPKSNDLTFLCYAFGAPSWTKAKPNGGVTFKRSRAARSVTFGNGVSCSNSWRASCRSRERAISFCQRKIPASDASQVDDHPVHKEDKMKNKLRFGMVLSSLVFAAGMMLSSGSLSPSQVARAQGPEGADAVTTWSTA